MTKKGEDCPDDIRAQVCAEALADMDRPDWPHEGPAEVIISGWHIGGHPANVQVTCFLSDDALLRIIRPELREQLREALENDAMFIRFSSDGTCVTADNSAPGRATEEDNEYYHRYHADLRDILIDMITPGDGVFG